MERNFNSELLFHYWNPTQHVYIVQSRIHCYLIKNWLVHDMIYLKNCPHRVKQQSLNQSLTHSISAHWCFVSLRIAMIWWVQEKKYQCSTKTNVNGFLCCHHVFISKIKSLHSIYRYIWSLKERTRCHYT